MVADCWSAFQIKDARNRGELFDAAVAETLLSVACDKEPRQIFENLRTKSSVTRLFITDRNDSPGRSAKQGGQVHNMLSGSGGPIIFNSWRSKRMSNSHQARLNVLVAEDNLLNQRFALRLLEKAGHAVTLAANGLEALEALRHNDFDLILMDVEMPVMDGLRATQAIRDEENEGVRIPIVAVTATGDAQACLRAGMDDWLPKPLSISRLNQSLEKVLAKSAA